MAGLPPATDLEGPLGGEVVPGHLRTVVVACFTSPNGLVVLLRQLREHGLGIVDVRRGVCPVEGSALVGPAVTTKLVPGGATFELAVAGDVEPGLHAELMPYAEVVQELDTALREGGEEGLGLVHVALLLEWHGVRVASIALPGPPAGTVPDQRRYSPVDSAGAEQLKRG